MTAEADPRFHLSLLGRFVLTGPDGVVGLPNKKLAALLTYLGCTAPVPQPRERLSTLLWGSHFDAQARQNLRQSLFKIRQILGADALESDGEFICLNTAVVVCDVSRLEALMRDGSLDALRAAADIYQGRLVDDVGVGEEGWSGWLAGERGRFRELAMNALVRLGEKELAAGHVDHALKMGQRANALNNLREDAHRLIIQALSATGRKAEAIKYYDDVVALIKREFSTEPDAATRALASGIRSEESSEARHPTEETHSRQPHLTRPAVVETLPSARDDKDDKSAATATNVDDLEQRQLTILVCKLVGSLSDLLDAEDVYDLTAAFHRMAAELVVQFDGFVADDHGHGVLVYFGYPAAHEHDAEQAVRAGRALLDAVGTLKTSFGPALRASAGIASGLVVVGEKTTAGDKRQHVAIGNAPNLAARLQAVAASGEVVIADGTRRLVGQMFDCRAFSTAEDNGLLPLAAWKVEGESAAVSRFHARRGPVMSPLMGRQEEADLLLRRWRQATRGDGGVVLLSGEAGIGKSRIAENLLAGIETESHTRLRFSCSPHHSHSSLHPLIDLLNRLANFETDSDPRAKLDRLRDLLTPMTDQVAHDVTLVAELMGIPEDARYPALAASPEQKREMIFAMLLDRLQGAAAHHPILAVIEDVHWIDPTSLDLLDRIVSRLAALPMLVVVTFRPEFQPTWLGQSNVTLLPLNRLGRRDSVGMIGGMTRNKRLPDDVIEQILSRTDGVPLFIEEFTNALLESGLLRETANSFDRDGPVPPLAVPRTLQASLVARLDRLGAARDVALTGAAIGREFSHELIAAVLAWSASNLDAALEQLMTSGLISRRGTPPDASYTFKHALVQDAAYATMLKKRRRQIHSAIVAAILDRFSTLAESQPEIVAHHSVEAGLATQAIDHWIKAARLARARWANREAAEFFDRALRLMAALSDSDETVKRVVDIRLELRSVLAQLAEPRLALECLREAETLVERLNDEHRRGRVYALMTNAHTLLAELDKALAFGTRALEVADRIGDLRLRIIASTYLEQVHFFRGDFRLVVTLATENLATLPADWASDSFGIETSPSVYDRGWLMMSLAELGQFAEASEPADEARQLARAIRHAHAIGWADISAGTVHMLKGEWAQARPFLEHSSTISKEGNVGVLYPSLVACLAWTVAQLGEASEALRLLREGEQLIQGHCESGYVGLLGWLFVRLGRAALVLGRLDDARRLGNRALEASLNQPGFAAHAHLLLGDIVVHPDRFDAGAGEIHFRDALAVAEKLGMLPLVAHSRHGLGKIYNLTGKLNQARDELTAATAMYRKMGMQFWLQQTETELRELQNAASDDF